MATTILQRMTAVAVASLAGTAGAIGEWDPDAVVSIFSPGRAVVELASRPHLRLEFSDIEMPISRVLLRGGRSIIRYGPGPLHVDAFLTFLAREQPSRLLIHCTAGLSRSPALALVALTVCGVDPALGCARLKAAAVQVQPNRRVLTLAEEKLGITGMRTAAETTFLYARGAFGAVGQRIDWFIV